ncbi:DUF6602 domain-containing protein [Catellatospora paridis]|uniref:DUF6602 domain-containing protein n=1 Tax=Catellatospora paridis TaxID=1617086 RepID=UPI0012D48CBD|nr:DUF6602 domain-containing protein [Catellatospora paridis]
MPIVEQYWAGALTRVNAEVQTFTRLIQHNLQRGEENEAVFARLLERLLPRKYSIGTGMVIDSDDQYSNQIDIVVYNPTDSVSLFAQSTELLYPVECVTGVVEVKSRLSTDDLTDIRRKARRLRELKPADGSSDPLDRYEGGLPYFAVLAYESRVSEETIIERFAAAPRVEQPDLVCVISNALVACRNGELVGSQLDSFFGGVCLEHRYDKAGRMQGQYEVAQSGDDGFDVGSVSYRVEAARALLLYLQALSGSLDKRLPPKASTLDMYLKSPVDEIQPINP